MQLFYIAIIVPALVLLPIVAGLIIKVYKTSSFKIILFYLVFSGITNVAERLLGMRHINNLPLLHVYTIIEFLFIMRFFQLALNHPATVRLAGWLMVIFPIFGIINFVFIQDIHRFNSYPRPVAALIIIAFCLFYFLKYSETENQKSWVYYPLTWIVSGLLVYFGSSLFYFAFLNVLIEKVSSAVAYLFVTIHATLVMVMYLLFTTGFLYAKNER